MSLSGTYSFNLTRNQIIENALRKIGMLADGNIPSPEQYSNASQVLNMIVKNLRAIDVMLWEVDWITIPLVASSVVLGTDGVDYECIRNHTSAAENRPVTGAKYSSFWRALSTSTGSAWVTATAYTSICNYALDTNIVGLSDLRSRDASSTLIMTELSRENYISLGNITTPGRPTQFYFFRQYTPTIFLYPYPNLATYVIEGFVYRYPQDFNNGSDSPDFLQEWILPLVDKLAYWLAPSAGIFGDQLRGLERQANESNSVAMMLDGEKGDVQFSARFR